jgi:hypothetical protein
MRMLALQTEYKPLLYEPGHTHEEDLKKLSLYYISNLEVNEGNMLREAE